jgi:quercetin 2,3-dioxygenase
MNTVLHKANSRGYADHGWLKSFHTFSFASYRNPLRTNFGVLRVLNDDVIQGGTGFGRHPHDNMEIISIPLSGALEHQDTSGGHEIIKSGEVQIMSAGSGIYHSEHNASKSDPANFLQIWIFPKEENIKPRYEQKFFQEEERLNKWQTLVSPDQANGSLWINQDAWFSRITLEVGKTASYQLQKPENGIYLFLIDGSLKAGGEQLDKRDALGLWNTPTLEVTAISQSDL